MVTLHIIHRKSVTSEEGGWGNKDCEKLEGPLNVLALAILEESRSMFSWTFVHATFIIKFIIVVMSKLNSFFFLGGGGRGGQCHLGGG